MAGDWIKMRADLVTCPKVVRIASALNADRLRVVGALHAVWCLFDVHSEDGKLDSYTPEVLDEIIGWVGFARAMSAVQWLSIGDGFLSVPRFDEHNGQSAKRRAMEAQRKRNDRAETSASEADKKRTREEKRREERNASASTAAAFDADTGHFQIPDLLMQQWRGAYPALSLDVELSKASAWLIANPKNRKSNYARFLTNWLSKAQDRAPRVENRQAAFEGGV